MTNPLTRLNQHGVEFVIIGGVCGIMHGTTLVTTDLDVCCRFTPSNLRRLESAVKTCIRLPAYRQQTAVQLTDELPRTHERLSSDRPRKNWIASGALKGVGDYEQVLKHSVVFQLSYGNFRILDLDTLITSKEALGRARDLEAVRQLRAVKERNERGQT